MVLGTVMHSSAEIRRHFGGSQVSQNSRRNSNTSGSVCFTVLQSGDQALMQELGDFPDDDLQVEQVEKQCRTTRHSVPEDGWVPGRRFPSLTIQGVRGGRG
ncbi:hypothetical protein CRUP_017866 [Coryphaenoides rupestris]|nr:hypothetical protein CRUP_017866 [Coryphaenoides rupestris]